MEIPIIIICVAFMALVGWVYLLYRRYDELLDILGEVGIALSEDAKEIDALKAEIEKLKATASAAEELLESAKELNEEQIKSEKAFRDGISAIVNY